MKVKKRLKVERKYLPVKGRRRIEGEKEYKGTQGGEVNKGMDVQRRALARKQRRHEEQERKDRERWSELDRHYIVLRRNESSRHGYT